MIKNLSFQNNAYFYVFALVTIYFEKLKVLTVSDWVPKKDSANLESDTFLWFAYVVNMSKIYSIVKDSNADLTVGNWESKIDP